MYDILSQAEIDELMKAIATGEDEEAQEKQPKDAVKIYDFKTANRFTKEQIRAINVVYKSFGHLVSNYLMGTLRATCEAEILSVEEMSFNEFNNSVPSPVIIGIVNTNPFNGSIIIELTKEIAYSIIGRVLGGYKEVPSEGRQFTEIELAIIERVLWQMLKNMDEAWGKVLDVQSSLEKVETSMQFAQIVDMNEPILLVTMNISIGNESGLVSFCLPHQALEPFTKKLTTRIWYSSAKKEVDVNPQTIMNSIVKSDITVRTIFNPTDASVKDVMSLRVGDVIQLQHKVNEPVVVKFEHLPKFKAEMGKYKNHCAVKIVDVIRGEENHG